MLIFFNLLKQKLTFKQPQTHCKNYLNILYLKVFLKLNKLVFLNKYFSIKFYSLIQSYIFTNETFLTSLALKRYESVRKKDFIRKLFFVII